MKTIVGFLLLIMCPLASAQNQPLKDIEPNLSSAQKKAIQSELQKLPLAERKSAKKWGTIRQVAQFICLPAAIEKIRQDYPNSSHISLLPNNLVWNQQRTLKGQGEIYNHQEFSSFDFSCQLENNTPIVKQFSYKKYSDTDPSLESRPSSFSKERAAPLDHISPYMPDDSLPKKN